MASTAFVINGSSESRSSNIETKFGITNVSITMITPTITTNRTIGYIMAFLTMPCVLACFSNCIAIRVSAFSRLPDDSPALTISIRIDGNIPESCRIESDNVSPFSTPDWASIIAFLRSLFSVCSANISRALTTLTPALSILANCLQNTLISLGLTFFFVRNGISISLSRALCCLIAIGVSPNSLSFLAASSLVSASICPFLSLPSFATAVYEYVSITTPLQ